MAREQYANGQNMKGHVDLMEVKVIRMLKIMKALNSIFYKGEVLKLSKDVIMRFEKNTVNNFLESTWRKLMKID